VDSQSLTSSLQDLTLTLNQQDLTRIAINSPAFSHALQASYNIPLSFGNLVSVLNKRLFYSFLDQVFYPQVFVLLLIINFSPLSRCLRCGRSLLSSANFYEICGRLGLSELVPGFHDSSVINTPFNHGSKP
jgi:hypothetical protein